MGIVKYSDNYLPIPPQAQTKKGWNDLRNSNKQAAQFLVSLHCYLWMMVRATKDAAVLEAGLVEAWQIYTFV